MGRPLCPGQSRAGGEQGSPNRWIAWGWWDPGSSTPPAHWPRHPWRLCRVGLSCRHKWNSHILGRWTSVYSQGYQHSPGQSAHHNLPNTSYQQPGQASWISERAVTMRTYQALYHFLSWSQSQSVIIKLCVRLSGCQGALSTQRLPIKSVHSVDDYTDWITTMTSTNRDSQPFTFNGNFIRQGGSNIIIINIIWNSEALHVTIIVDKVGVAPKDLYEMENFPNMHCRIFCMYYVPCMYLICTTDYRPCHYKYVLVESRDICRYRLWFDQYKVSISCQTRVLVRPCQFLEMFQGFPHWNVLSTVQLTDWTMEKCDILVSVNITGVGFLPPLLLLQPS